MSSNSPGVNTQESISDKVNIGLIGLGHWGPNLVRNFGNHPRARVRYVCDISESALARNANILPQGCAQTKLASDIFNSPQVDAVVIATSASTHYQLVKDALMAKKHVFCEKPLTLNVEQDEELCELADRFNLKLMVGYTFLFNNGINKVKELINKELLGQLYYLMSTRTHLGLVRQDVGAVWDLAPHDISIMNYLMDSTPEMVSAVGGTPLGFPSKEDFAFINLFYTSKVMGRIHVSWVDSNKERIVQVIGSKARVVFDDLNDLEPVRYFEKGIAPESWIKSDFGEFKLLLRDGDIISPKIQMQEPLKRITDGFIRVLLDNEKNVTDSRFALNITRCLAAIHRSIKNAGAPEKI